MNDNAIYNVTHGVYVLSARLGEKDNGCIVDAVMQATAVPLRIVVGVNKSNLTHGMVVASRMFNISVLTDETPLKVFQHFGYQSGRDVNKFATCESEHRSDNGVLYVPKYTNAYISARVVEMVDMGSHTLFVGEITESKILGGRPGMTYGYYQQHVKPQSANAQKGATRWVCQTCGYVYEGETLPDGFVCPWCKHGADAFVKMEQ